MENTFRERSQRRFGAFRKIYDITMALIFLAVAFSMFFLEQFKLDLVFTEDKLYRYFFGSICLLYGGFRLYRGFKQNDSL